MIVSCAHKLTPELRDQVIRLLGDHAYKHALWEWQFEQVPQADQVKLIVARDEQGVVQGFNGSLPVQVQIDGVTTQAHWSCDFIVAASARGHGLGTSMKNALARECPVLMASGISDAADRVHHALGWARAAMIPQFSRTQRIRRWQDYVRMAVQTAGRLLRGRRIVQRADVTCEVVDAEHLPQDALQIWRQVADQYPNAVVRSPQYLNWRYRGHPLMRYQAIVVREQGSVAALAFFWVTPDKAVLVDYVGPRNDDWLTHELVRTFLSAGAQSLILECSTTHRGLQRALQSFGFVTWRRAGTLFNVYPARLAGAEHDWFAMGGDSDGDILAAARVSQELRIERWSEQQFLAARAEWNDLLKRSAADRLFLSWEWLSSWWRVYAARDRLELYCLAVRDRQDRLVGIAPLYVHRANLRGLISRRIQFLGNVWQGRATMRTEYLEFIVDRRRAEPVVMTILDQLGRAGFWHDFVLTDLDQQSETYQQLLKHRLARDCYVRYVARHTGYGIATRGTWQDYLHDLSGNQRRKLFLQRRLLEARGKVSLEWFGVADFEQFADRLDMLHALRWGRPFFTREMRSFHRQLLRAFHDDEILHASVLTVAGQDISALYNVRIAGREYNLQGGFDERFYRGVSVALLHLGYIVEQAFSDGIERIDLLVGGGKKGDFKTNISQVVVRSTAMHVLRSPLRKSVHRLYDRARRGPERRGVLTAST